MIVLPVRSMTLAFSGTGVSAPPTATMSPLSMTRTPDSIFGPAAVWIVAPLKTVIAAAGGSTKASAVSDADEEAGERDEGARHCGRTPGKTRRGTDQDRRGDADGEV